MSPFFSVVIPVFNKELYVGNTIKSVLAQSFTHFEIVVINDGSTDGSEASILSIKDDRIRYVYQKNQGLSATRNTGIELAQGKIVALIDADDLWNKNYLQSIFDLQSQFKKANFYGTEYIEKHANNQFRKTAKTLSKKHQGKMVFVEDFFQANMGQPIICMSSISFRKSVFDGKKPFNEGLTLAEDVDFYIRWFSTEPLAYCYKPLVTVQVDVPDQMTKWKKTLQNFLDFSTYQNLVKNNPSLEKYLDFKRYNYTCELKLEGANNIAKTIKNQINFKNLTAKQRFLLNCPVFLLRAIKWCKKLLLKFNIRVTTYR